MRHFFVFSIVLIPALYAQLALPAQTIHFTHGQWFNGTAFTATDFYSTNGLLSQTAPAEVDETVDLHNAFLIPPFGDAHEHNFDDSGGTPAVARQYLRDGIFYAQGMTDVLDGAREVIAAHLVDTPETPDVTYAHGGLTGIDGHPKEVYEAIPPGFYNPADDAQKDRIRHAHLRAGQAYWEIGSPADLAAKWPAILDGKPDLIKVYMSDSEHYTADLHQHPRFAAGLDPALVPLIVARAHAAHLRVAAHVDTLADVHIALTSGVNILAHLPGYCINTEDPATARVADADIALMVRQHTAVIPTASICESDQTPATQRAAIRKVELDNLSRLKAAGANLLIGSDHYSQDSLLESQYFHSLGLWSNLELLRIWAVATPQSIFPTRKIGQLAAGYEATFLVLAINPLTDWSATAHITDRWKQGHHLTPPAPRATACPAGHKRRPSALKARPITARAEGPGIRNANRPRAESPA